MLWLSLFRAVDFFYVILLYGNNDWCTGKTKR